MKRALRYSLAVCSLSWLLALAFHLATGYTGHPSGDQSADIKARLLMTVFSAAYMFLPLVTAVLMGWVENRFFPADPPEPGFRSSLMRFRPKWSWLVGLALVPVVVSGALLCNSLFADLVWDGTASAEFQQALEKTGMSVGQYVVVTVFSGLFAGLTINALFAFGEEYGWRRYMVDALRGEKFWKAALLVGIVWGLWHFPIILMGHNYPVHRVAGVFLMCGMTVLLGVIELYFVLRSGSVWPAAVIHGTFNALAGAAVVFVKGGDDLLNGMPGASGMIAMGVAVAALYAYDRWWGRDGIFTATIGSSLAAARGEALPEEESRTAAIPAASGPAFDGEATDPSASASAEEVVQTSKTNRRWEN